MKGIIKNSVRYMDSFIGKEITFIEGDEVEILKSIKSKNYPSGLAYVCYNPNNNASMTLDSSLFEIVNYSEEEYREMAKSFIGKSIKTSYGNGFFVRDSFDLEGAIILNIYEEKDYENDNYVIVVKVIKNNEEYDYALFDGSWRKWEYVYRHLYEWVNHEGDV